MNEPMNVTVRAGWQVGVPVEGRFRGPFTGTTPVVTVTRDEWHAEISLALYRAMSDEEFAQHIAALYRRDREGGA